MALLTSCTSANKVDTELPKTIVVRNRFMLFGSPWYWVETIVTESFKYIGLTKEAAASGQATLIAEYTKDKNIPYVNDVGGVSFETVATIVADIRTTPVGGNGWEISVSVNEKTYTFEPIGTEA